MSHLPQMGFGTWGIGGRAEEDRSRDNEGIAAIRTAIEAGITLLDTAEYYGAGHCEEIVGRAITPFPRAEICLVSKVWKEHLHEHDVVAAAQRSLERLRTDYIDLYLIHWPNPEVSITETMAGMRTLLSRGVIRAVGLSNFTVPLIREAELALGAHISANEIEWNLSMRDAEKEIVPYCREQNIDIIAYRPLERGALASTPLLHEIAKRYNKTPAQVALNWLIAQGATPIPKALNPAHIKENAGALGWSLEASDLALLANLHHKQ